MTIAVIMSTYNGEIYVEEQIESILNQRLRDIKLNLYVRDDGSTDRTAAILNRYDDEGKLVFINKNNIENLKIQKSFLSGLKYAFDDSVEADGRKILSVRFHADPGIVVENICLFPITVHHIHQLFSEAGVFCLQRKNPVHLFYRLPFFISLYL